MRILICKVKNMYSIFHGIDSLGITSFWLKTILELLINELYLMKFLFIGAINLYLEERREVLR